MRKYLSEVAYLLGDDVRVMPFLVLMFVVVSLIDVVGIGLIAPYVSILIDPELVSSYVELPVGGLGDNAIVWLGILLVSVFFVKFVLAITIHYKIISFAKKQQIRLVSILMNKYQSMPYGVYVERNSSEYIYSIRNLVGQFTGGVVVPGLKIVSDGIIALFIIGWLAWSDIEALAVLVGVLSLVLYLYDYSFRSKIHNYGVEVNTANTLTTKAIQEGFDGFKEIKVLGCGNYFFERVVGGSKWAAKVTSYNQLLLAIPRYLIELLLVSFVVLLVLFKVLSEENVMSIIPTLSMFGVAAIRLLPSSSTFSSGMAQLRYGRDGVSRLYKDLKEWEFDNLFVEGRNKKIEGGNGRSFESLVLSDVKFKYRSSDSYILRGVSFEIFAGESIGLIGGSGAGKTTLVDIVLGLLDPVEGRIVYNNENIHDVGGVWRSQVAYLPQQVFIIDDTIMRNVALGVDDSEIDYDRLARALERARLTDFVEGLLDGYDTVLGERGVKMSGGQRQRIALARAFYHERNVLVLDESTSALDVETEAEVIDEIRMLHGKVTMIIIAHRHSMLKNCDRIYKLEEGEVVELSLDSYG